MTVARQVQCKTGFGVARAINRKVVHRIDSVDAACDGERIRYIASWMCGGFSRDVTLVASLDALSRTCGQCDLAARGEGFVYHCFGTADVLYIGSAIDAEHRLRGHELLSSWWPEVIGTHVETYPDIETARRAEAAAIEAERPVHNKKHNKHRMRRTGGQWHPVNDLLREAA
jgi:hypothetical protein